jgi:hypothetical protein
MNGKPPLVILDSFQQDIFDQVRDYLAKTLKDIKFKESNPKQDNSATKVLEHLNASEMDEAYELLYSLHKENDTSDILFLGLAYTNFFLNFLEAAEKYASQASKLHGLVTDGAEAELFEALAQTLSQIAETWKNSKVLVNNRFINLYPTQEQLEQPNAVDLYVMEGLKPEKPFITKSDRIATIGSCFTGNVSTFLRHNGFDVPTLNTEYKGNLSTGSFSDEVFNTYVLRYLFELAFGDETLKNDSYEVINQHSRKTTFSVENIQKTLSSSNVFIITLGLSEVWFNKQNGEVYKTAKGVGDYDEAIHDFRVTTVQENLENIDYVYRAIRKNVENAAVIFTLSPVPLKATFRDIGCVPANSISKAILRVALDELVNRYPEDNQLHYFPSYELIVDSLPHPFGPDRRYISSDTVNFVMSLFANHYVVHEA